MFSYRAVVAYDGRDFHGMAEQRGLRTISGELLAALTRAFKSCSGFSYSGRTDAGVHALGQVVVFSLAYDIRCSDVQKGVNGQLPADIRVLRVNKCAASFSPRHDAVYKVYRFVLNTGSHDPLEAFRVYQYGKRLDVAAMRRACAVLIGTHDFLSYSADTRDMTVRTLHEITISKKGTKITLTFRGKSFLRYMVRMLTGSLIAVGAGKMDADDLQRLLRQPRKGSSKMNVPPHGLTLVRVVY